MIYCNRCKREPKNVEDLNEWKHLDIAIHKVVVNEIGMHPLHWGSVLCTECWSGLQDFVIPERYIKNSKGK